MQQFSRREFLGVAATAGAGALAAGCLDTPAPKIFTQAEATITARPGTPSATPTIGYTPLGIATVRDGFLYVPTTYNPSVPAPLLLLLHGRQASAEFWETSDIDAQLDDLGIVVVAPDSRGSAWDLFVNNGYGPDVQFMNLALTWAFAHCNINPTRIAMGGFSDGASETLGVGLANGDLFSHLICYSPGVLYAPWLVGKPKMWITHGSSDLILSADNTKNDIVPRLQNEQYDVTYVEHTGVHEVPADKARESFQWFLS